MPYPAGLMVWKKLTPQPVPSWTKGLEAILTLVKGNIYTMEINDYPKKLKYIAKIEAKLPLQQLYAFSPEAWEKNNAMFLSKIKEAEERLASEATVFRTLKVQQFGVFNCDRFVNDPRKVQLSASFNFDTEINDKLNNVHVYFMSDELKTVIMLPQLKNSLINMVPCKDARLFAVLPGNRLAVFSPTDFAKINFDELRKTTDPSYTFPLKSSAQVITSEADIKKVLQM